MRVMFILFFPLFGVYDYLIDQNHYFLGYLVFMIPLSLSILYVYFIKNKLIESRSTDLRLFFQRDSINLFHAILLSSYLLIILIGFFRVGPSAAQSNTILAYIGVFSVIVMFFYVLIVEAIKEKYFDSLLDFIGISLFLLMLGNIIGFLAGISNPGVEGNYKWLLNNPLPLFDYRIDFPFTRSGRMLSIQAGLLTLFGIFRIKNMNHVNDKLLGLSMVACGLAVLIGHGGKASILLLICVLLFVAFWKIIRPFLFPLLVLFILFPVLVVIGELGSDIKVITDIMGIQLTRDQMDVLSLSHRDKIFTIIMLGYLTQGDILSQLVGYGAYGQVPSGLSYKYAMFFWDSYTSPYKMPAHNSLLQVLMDYGYIGVVLFTLLILNMAKLIRKNTLYREVSGFANKDEKLLTALLLYLVGSSMTEISITYFSLGNLSIFVVLNMLLLFDRTSVLNKYDLLKKI